MKKWFVVIVLFILMVSTIGHKSSARHPCRQNLIVQNHHALVEVPQTVFYFVGQPLRIQALVQVEQQNNVEYQQFLQWKQGQYKQLNNNLESKNINPVSILNQKCSSCHGGKDPIKPAGKLSLLTNSTISGKVLKEAIRRVRLPKNDLEHMPKNAEPLDPAEKGALIMELIQLLETREN